MSNWLYHPTTLTQRTGAFAEREASRRPTPRTSLQAPPVGGLPTYGTGLCAGIARSTTLGSCAEQHTGASVHDGGVKRLRQALA